MIGRPTKMTGTTVHKLEQAFLVGCTDREACIYADVSKSTLYNYCRVNPDFMERKELLKNSPQVKAKMIISQALEDGDLATANKVLDRKERLKIKQSSTVINLAHEQWLGTLK
jgi:hypothetical protein